MSSEIPLYPLLRGRDVSAWLANLSALIIVPHAAADFSVPLSVEEVSRSAPLTLEYFGEFEKALRSRSGYRQLHKERPEFYVVGNTGNYTLAPHKVVFKELTDVFQCAVISPEQTANRVSKPVIPDHKLLFLVCSCAEEAHFVAGLPNSIPARAALYSASVGVQTQADYPTDVSRIRLPDCDPKNAVHRNVVRLSQECHEIARADGGSGQLVALGTDLASATSDIGKIPSSEREPLMAYYTKIRSFRKRAAPSESMEEEV
ncbi:MAG: hypothetical protein HY304_08045 [candidate division Zixibacteria bacterium]|nr:hypothetical protein [candidate division Zixibacteria bacterium]